MRAPEKRDRSRAAGYSQACTFNSGRAAFVPKCTVWLNSLCESGRLAPAPETAAGIVAEHRQGEERDRAGGGDGEGRRLEPQIEREADQFDGMREGVQDRRLGKPWVRVGEPPERVERGRGEEHGEHDEVHHAREILELPNERGKEKAERAVHGAGEEEGRKKGEIA